MSLGLVPHLVVGDLDSLTGEVRRQLQAKEVPIKRFPREKDETDTELALIEALNRQPEEVIIFAGIGDRLDHSLANIFLLAGYLSSGIPIRLATPLQTLWATDRSVAVRGYPGQTVSLLPLSPVVRDLTLKGFYYPLENGLLRQGSSLGISNVLLGETGEIRFSDGILLIVQSNSE